MQWHGRGTVHSVSARLLPIWAALVGAMVVAPALAEARVPPFVPMPEGALLTLGGRRVHTGANGVVSLNHRERSRSRRYRARVSADDTFLPRWFAFTLPARSRLGR